MKILTGGSSASSSLSLKKPQALYDEQFVLRDKVSQAPLAGAHYRIESAKGEVIAAGITDAQGQTARVHGAKADKLSAHWGQARGFAERPKRLKASGRTSESNTLTYKQAKITNGAFALGHGGDSHLRYPVLTPVRSVHLQ